jgi:hypothetical protein
MKLNEAEKILNENGYVLQETRRLGTNKNISISGLKKQNKYEAMKNKLIEELDGDCPSQESLIELGFTMVGDPHDGDYYYAEAKPGAKSNRIFQVYDGEVQIDVEDYQLGKWPVNGWFKALESVATNKYLD